MKIDGGSAADAVPARGEDGECRKRGRPAGSPPFNSQNLALRPVGGSASIDNVVTAAGAYPAVRSGGVVSLALA
jgi:hypothetical protein